MREILSVLTDELEAGRRVALATVVRATGSTPRPAGARMLIRSDGSTFGTVGGGIFEALVIQDAQRVIESPLAEPTLRTYTFAEEGEHALGMACGGTAEVFLEIVSAGERLVVFGAGHVGLALGRLAARVGFRVQIVDDREAACAAARGAGSGEVFRCDPDFVGGVPELDAHCYVAVVTRCHRTDRLALRSALKVPLRYVGLIGSRRKRTVIFDQLRDEDGATVEDLSRVRCPIGLPIGGDSPEEIAVSIVAELLQVRHGKTALPG